MELGGVKVVANLVMGFERNQLEYLFRGVPNRAGVGAFLVLDGDFLVEVEPIVLRVVSGPPRGRNLENADVVEGADVDRTRDPSTP